MSKKVAHADIGNSNTYYGYDSQNPYQDNGASRNPPPYNQQEAIRDVSHSYIPTQQQPGQVNGVLNANIVPETRFASKGMPVKTKCPNCHLIIITNIKAKTSTRTFVSVGALLVVFWPLAFIPFVTKKLKKKVHICPSCGYNLGKEFTYVVVPN